MADHVLHFTPCGDGTGGEWRLECVHDPDDPQWFARWDGHDEGDTGRCWTIDWFDNDYDSIRGEWPEDPTFPLPVDCIWNDDLEVRPWTP